MRGLLLFILILLSLQGTAQMVEDPTTWKLEVKKVSKTQYDLIFHLQLKTGWHIYSLTPGGDGFEIPPSFSFPNNAKIKLEGAIKEKGKATTEKVEGIEHPVTTLSGKVDYIQRITATGPTKLMGKHTYQVCNDQMCLPPKDRPFTFDIK